MKITYSDFLNRNKNFPKKADSLLILFRSNTYNACICMNQKGEKYQIYIPVLIRETLKKKIRLIEAWRLKEWDGWTGNIDYPLDYKQNREEYYHRVCSPKLGIIHEPQER